MGEVGDETRGLRFDLNKEPVERKRKRGGSLADKGLVRLPEPTGRVLRSRTVGVSVGEKEVIKKDVGKVENEEGECEGSGMLKIEETKKKRRGRPPRKESACGVSSSGVGNKGDQILTEGDDPVTGVEMKGNEEDESKVPAVSLKTDEMKPRRGRPPKGSGRREVSSLKIQEKDDKVINDGEKQVIKTEIVEMEDQVESDMQAVLLKRRGRPPKSKMVEIDDKDGSEVTTVSLRKRKMKGRVGRPPKVEVDRRVSSSNSRRNDDMGISGGEKKVIKRESVRKRNRNGSEFPIPLKRKIMKARRGRPPKVENKYVVSSSVSGRKNYNVTERNKFDESINGAGCGIQVKRRPGRPAKVDNGNSGIAVKEKKRNVNSNGDDERAGNASGSKRLKIGPSSNDTLGWEKVRVDHAKGNDMRPREQKQLLREQIVAMLKKAGWTVEYRQRLSKIDYQDAVYVDQEGRAYWSVTLAYKKLKERIDAGEATDMDKLAFTPIPDETLSILFRITEKGKKAGKKKQKITQKGKQAGKKKESARKTVQGKIRSKSGRDKGRTLLARKPRAGSDGDGYELYEGKRSLLTWMIDLGTVPLGGRVRYQKGRAKRNVLVGRITKDGISCDCCNTMHTVWDFESHAQSTLGKPYQNIYLESGDSLLKCLGDSWKKHVENDNIRFAHVAVDGGDPNDDTCNICADGGDLVCCDSCPATFHHGCLHMEIPSGDWHCVYCSCKFCEMAGESTSSTDDNHDSSSDLFMCRLCEEKFHANCIKEEVAEDFDYENPSFCGIECQKISEQLQVLIGVRHELEDGFFYTVLQHREVSSEALRGDDFSKVESNSKLAVAFAVMDECFETITDERSGTNMIHNVVYNCGSNIRRLDYGGFLTIILEKGDETVAAASIRIHGSQLAEMPFIGTRYVHRRKGMCSRLLTAIEKVLCSLGVEKLVIPAISELNETWTKVFRFSPIEESKRLEMKYMSMVVFPGIDMLQKPVTAHQLIKTQTEPAATECMEVEAVDKSLQENSASDSNTCSDKMHDHDEAAKVEPSANVPNGPDHIEVEDNQNTQDEKNEDIGDGAARASNCASSEVQIAARGSNGACSEIQIAAPTSDDCEVEITAPTSNGPEAENDTPSSNDPESEIAARCPEVEVAAPSSDDPEFPVEPNGCFNGLPPVIGNGEVETCDDDDGSGGNKKTENRIDDDASGGDKRIGNCNGDDSSGGGTKIENCNGDGVSGGDKKKGSCNDDNVSGAKAEEGGGKFERKDCCKAF